MGFDCQLLGLRLVQPKLYVIEEIGAFAFPISKQQIKEGAIEEMVNLLTFAREHAVALSTGMAELQKAAHVNKMTKVLNSAFAATTTTATDDWCSEVVWPSGKTIPHFVEDEEEEDEEEEGEEEEGEEEEDEEEEEEEDEEDEDEDEE
ncbi:hypothetical protein RMATCC62417_11064 [Rhizopus microsporus]|nr:hypothetical protein RMATCC62417_11064 [Rhizopus microsporus]